MEGHIVTTLITIMQFMALIHLILSLIFCVLALFVLVYHIRKRYKLYKEINRIPQELLMKESYRNHLKNLKIKCIINNFIIVIVIMEFLQNLGRIFNFLPSLITYFIKQPEFYLRSLLEIQNYCFLLAITMDYLLVPVLSMMMDFLWLAYRKYEYKYTIIRWTWYIVIRGLIQFLVGHCPTFISIFVGYQTIYDELAKIIVGILPIIDFIQFVYYARKFYLHLKSREKEIRLFYFDKKAFLDIKFLRIHFKIATILVGIALLLFTITNADNLLFIFDYISLYITIPQQLNQNFLVVFDIFVGINGNLSYIISQVLFILNYLYIFIVVVYKSYRDGQKLKNINSYIKPIMKQYHDNYYNRYTNYA